MIIDEKNYLAHYGILRRSGRYPWGSGKDQAARNKSFLDYVDGLRKEGLSEVEIARGVGITTTQLRAAKSIAKNEQKQADIAFAQRLKDKGMSNIAIGKRMGINESSVRALLAPAQKDRADVLQTTASMLKDQVAKKTFVDVGSGVENHLGISATKLSTAVALLKEQGYEVHSLKISQVGTGEMTTFKVLAPPGTTQKEVWTNREKIQQITDFSDDGGVSFSTTKPPISISSKRIGVAYKEDGGAAADGVMYIRPGVKDLSLGAARYAQVRVMVDQSHFLKGMAMYKDDLPSGTDLVFNTNKSNTGNKLDAMKELKDDPDNPFGSSIRRQIVEKDANGNEHVTSAMNIVNEEGDWEAWSKSLASQMLSKQSPALAKTQLDMTYERKKNEFDAITALTNPTVRKKLLESFADAADSSAVHLKAHHLPRQGTHAILPMNSMKETEIYAPNFRPGERVVLIRYPHGGIFEIPELTVNNNHREAKKVLGQAKDAVGINSKVAERLSGADFDGDSVLVIPNNRGEIKTAPALLGLKDFDTKTAYPAYEGMPKMSDKTKQQQMGDVSNLITDMTIKGANQAELARAVRHSMVVIDAEKHHLNYKQSAKDNGIAQLKEKYQGGKRAGASTLISRAGSKVRVPHRKARSAAAGGPIDVTTGRKVFEETGKLTKNKQGEVIPKLIKTKRLAETHDATTLMSKPGTVIEKLYADHSNRLKDLANQARREMVNTKTIPYSPSAKAVYSKEVADLNAKLNIALRNRPLERQAQILANATVRMKRQANPNMDEADLKKVRAQALIHARSRTGAGKKRIQITDNEWAAIQAGAISTNKLKDILDNSDLDVVKQLATPRTNLVMTSAKQTRAKAMLNSGYSQSEVADALGVALSTLKSSIGGE